MFLHMSSESEVTSLNMAEKDSMEPGGTLSSERSHLETSSNTNSQEEAIKGDPGSKRAS